MLDLANDELFNILLIFNLKISTLCQRFWWVSLAGLALPPSVSKFNALDPALLLSEWLEAGPVLGVHRVLLWPPQAPSLAVDAGPRSSPGSGW